MDNYLPLSNEYLYPNYYNYGAATPNIGQNYYAPQILSFGNGSIQNDSFMQNNQEESSKKPKSSNNGLIVFASLAVAATLGFVFRKNIAGFLKGEQKAASNLNKNPLNTASSDVAASSVQAPPSHLNSTVPAEPVVSKVDLQKEVSIPATTPIKPPFQPEVVPSVSTHAQLPTPSKKEVEIPKTESNVASSPKITGIANIKKTLLDAGVNKKLIEVLTEEQAEFISKFGMHDAQFKTVLTSEKLDKDVIEYMQASIDDALLGLGCKKAGKAIPKNDAIKSGLVELQKKADDFITEVKSNQNLKDELKFLQYKNIGVAFRRMLAETDARFIREGKITGALSITEGEAEMVKMLQARPELKDKIISRAALDHGLDAVFNGIADYKCPNNAIQELLNSLNKTTKDEVAKTVEIINKGTGEKLAIQLKSTVSPHAKYRIEAKSEKGYCGLADIDIPDERYVANLPEYYKVKDGNMTSALEIKFIGTSANYKGIGTEIVRQVVQDSQRMGYDGRVWLSACIGSLPNDVKCLAGAKNITSPVPAYYKMGFRFDDPELNQRVEKGLESLKQCGKYTGPSDGNMFLPQDQISRILKQG